MGGSNPNAGGQRRMCGPFLVAGAALHGSVILESVETECWGVNAECVVHASWQAQHCSRCPLVFCCVYRSLAKTWLDISCICDWRGIVEGLETERGGVKTEGVFLCLCHLQRNGLIIIYTFYVYVTGGALWRGSKPNAGGSTPNAWSISGGNLQSCV